jgi:hypothetical protein
MRVLTTAMTATASAAKLGAITATPDAYAKVAIQSNSLSPALPMDLSFVPGIFDPVSAWVDQRRVRRLVKHDAFSRAIEIVELTTSH